jgi:hypothetical protein
LQKGKLNGKPKLGIWKRIEAAEAFRQKQLALQVKQLALMEGTERAGREAEQSQIKLLKKFGNVLHNTVVKLGNDVLIFIHFCDNTER